MPNLRQSHVHHFLTAILGMLLCIFLCVQQFWALNVLRGFQRVIGTRSIIIVFFGVPLSASANGYKRRRKYVRKDDCILVNLMKINILVKINTRVIE